MWHEPRVQVIGAHSADFVWRAGGAIAKAAAAGGTAEVIALSYGERGESGELWKEEGQTIENVKRDPPRRGRGARPAHLGATFRCLDLGDYPLQIDGDALLAIADAIREFAPDVARSPTPTPTRSTRTTRSPTPPSTARAASPPAPACSSAFATIKPPPLFLFEPHQPELCNFTPTVFVDITAVWEQKRAAMAEMKAQPYLQTYYAQRAEQRGNHARRASGDAGGPPGRVVPARDPAGGGAAVMTSSRGWASRPSTRRPAARAWSTPTCARSSPARAPRARRARCAAARTTT